MIGRLRGILVSKQPPWLVIDVGGVGYELEAPMSTFFDLPEVGREVSLCTHYAVKEDTVALYGFLREAERSALVIISPDRITTVAGRADVLHLTARQLESLSVKPIGWDPSGRFSQPAAHQSAQHQTTERHREAAA